ncbi:MAG TPA: acyltransferase, partial [Acidimicrobiales bacterium]
MTSALEVPTDGSLLPNGLETGTAPGDRRFRPDVEGLRAVAVLLVVLYHASFPGLSGGYVGVDVFFVISGFVITGVLLRERAATGGTSILHFYGRRCRRIIPAATLVIIATVTLAYVVLGVVYGNRTAVDGRWTSVFLANVHFASVGTNYLSSQQSPSLLQNFWTLAVEEQFYLVYPTLFLVAAAVRSRVSLHVRLATGLIVVIVASFVLSVAQTASNPTVAYFSPLTRAWELALGALVAVGARWLLTLSKGVAATMTWVGLGAILIAAFGFDSTTAYPGWLVAVPVVGAALIIAGGTPVPRHSAESILRLAPFQWTGRLSYSIYLWHWPILMLAADAVGKLSLPFRQNLVWLAVALAASMVTFRLVENPVRRARLPV